MDDKALMMFNRWDVSGVKVDDAGLKSHINTDPIIVPRSGGRYATIPFHKNKMSIVERLMNKLMVSGHSGKKHKLTSRTFPGNSQTIYFHTKKAFEMIEKKTSKNPVQVLVKAVENSSPMEEIAAYRLGGMIARQPVTVSPQRRLDLALRYLTQGIYKSTFKSKSKLSEAIANEIIAAYSNDPKSFAINERNRIEREAEGAR